MSWRGLHGFYLVSEIVCNVSELKCWAKKQRSKAKSSAHYDEVWNIISFVSDIGTFGAHPTGAEKATCQVMGSGDGFINW